MEDADTSIVTPKMEYEQTSTAFRHHQTIMNTNLTTYFAFSLPLSGLAAGNNSGLPLRLFVAISGLILSAIWINRASHLREINGAYVKRLIELEKGNGLFSKDAELRKTKSFVLLPTASKVMMLVYWAGFLLFLAISAALAMAELNLISNRFVDFGAWK